MKNYRLALLTMYFFSATFLANAQIETILLYDGEAPFTKKGIDRDELGEGGRVTRVAVPELTVYHPTKASANKMAILICPGGGYGLLAIAHEGHAIAQWYSERGYVAAVLKYRLPEEELLNEPWLVPLSDAKAGIQQLRKKANQWGIDPQRVGVLGFSAGGHLASTLSVHGEKAKNHELSSRPDFSILVYPVISMDTTITHRGSRKNLLGEKVGTEWENYFSTETQVNESTPPAFIVHSWDDRSVPAENSIRYAMAINKFGTNVELHLFEKGGHGYGIGNRENHGNAAEWIAMSDKWIRDIRF